MDMLYTRCVGLDMYKDTVTACARVLAAESPYYDLGSDYFDHFDRARTIKRLVRKLEDLGCEVELMKTA